MMKKLLTLVLAGSMCLGNVQLAFAEEIDQEPNECEHVLYVSDVVPAALAADGVRTYSCEKCDYTESETIPGIADVSLDNTTFVYDGSEKSVSAAVYDTDGNLIAPESYEVTYAADRCSVGTHVATVTFKGDYSGSVDEKYKITLAAPVVEAADTEGATPVISWSEVAGATGYYVYKSVDDGPFSYTKVKGSKTTYTEPEASAYGKYTYKVKAYTTVDGDTVKSGYSNEADWYKVAAPVIKDLSNQDTGVYLSWKMSGSCSGYYIYRSADGSAFEKVKKITNGETCAYMDKNVEAGRSYQYEIFAFVSSGDKTFSSEHVQSEKIVRTASGEIVSADNAADGVSLKWNKVDNISGYYIYRSTDGKSFSKKYTLSSKAVSCKDTAVTSGNTYYYRVCPYTEADGVIFRGAASNTAEIIYLEMPSNIAAGNSTNGIKVSWEKVEGVSGYYIYRNKNGEGFKKLATVTNAAAASYSDKNANEECVSYQYKIIAFAQFGENVYKSKVSDVAIAKRILAPENVAVKAVSSGISLSWDAKAGVDGYYIFRKVDGGSYNKIASIEAAGTHKYTDTDVSNGKEYRYKIYAYAKNGEAIDTGLASAAAGMIYLSQPTKLSLANVTGGVSATWKQNKYADGYHVYRSTADGSFKKIETITGNENCSFLDAEAVENGTKYQYRIVSFAGADDAESLSFKSTAKVIYALSKPSVSKISSTEPGQFTAIWKKNAQADGYEFQYARNIDFSDELTVFIDDAATGDVFVGSLAEEQVYYVRVRSYKVTEDGKSYSAWSAKKNVTIKKSDYSYMWPLPGNTTITSPFGSRICPFHGHEYHNAIDISANARTPILACERGTVVTATYSSSFGNYVIINHGNGMTTQYSHCSSLSVSVGQYVNKGQVVGYVGMTGNATGNHLDLRFCDNGVYKNPLDYITPQ